MNVKCRDLERVLREQEPEEMKALKAHASECAACRAELEAWNEISVAAQSMQRNWESPNLWPRIHQQLAEESQRVPRSRWSWPALWEAWGRQWKTAAMALVLAVVTLTAVWMARRPAVPGPDLVTGPKDEKRLLTEQAVAEIQAREKAYLESIERLARLAEPKIAQPNTPLLANYREKLLVIDAAIAECRAIIDQNQFNPNLRKELLAIYQEKEKTLESLAKEAAPAGREKQN